MDLITVTREAGLAFTIGVRGHHGTGDMAAREAGRDAGPWKHPPRMDMDII